MLNNRPTSVRSVAPCRVDLAGGTLDIWPLGLLHAGSLTVNIAIPVEVELVVDLAGETGSVLHTSPKGEVMRFSPAQAITDLTAAVTFSVVPQGGVRIRVISQAPFRSGIGGSSSYGIALMRALNALMGRAPDEKQMVALVRDLEARVLGVPTGEQDHWAAVRGGVLALHIDAGGNRVEGLDVAPGWLSERMTVFYSGIRHRSGMVNWQVVRRRLDGDAATTSAFDEIASAARDCRTALLAQDEKAVGVAIQREWKARRQLAPDVSTVELDELISVALDHGATAVKACGAGGGGSIVVWHPVGTRSAIVSELEKASNGGRVLATCAAAEGVRLIPES
jgi:D-glycero-alpha-D-manno-heptose-7-phosphate kinase